jgi:hypothetical protein
MLCCPWCWLRTPKTHTSPEYFPSFLELEFIERVR